MENIVCYEVRQSDVDKGLGVFATAAVKEKSVIFEERPLLSAQFAWNKEYKYLACDHCLRPLESTEENVRRLTQNTNIVIPYCELCPTTKELHHTCLDCGTKYCCESCKEEAAKLYHKLLCQYRERLGNLHRAWMNIHFPPETTSIELILRILAYIEMSGDKGAAVSELMQFSHDVVNERNELSLKLLGNDFVANLHYIQPLLAEVLPLTAASPLVTEEGVKELFGLVGRNGQGIGTSVFSQWVNSVTDAVTQGEEKEFVDKFIESIYDRMDEVVGTFLNCEGSGLYKLQRCLNHSCRPNAAVTFPYSNHTLQLVALSNIEPGDEICISYIDECDLLRSRHSRNKILRDYYLFECRCQRCLDAVTEPDVTSEEECEIDE